MQLVSPFLLSFFLHMSWRRTLLSFDRRNVCREQENSCFMCGNILTVSRFVTFFKESKINLLNIDNLFEFIQLIYLTLL